MQFKFLPKNKIGLLPRTSGVYAFKAGRQFFYIGKARNIAERVKNHFQRPVYRDGFFINNVKKVGWISTNSEIEAFILEADLIKKYQPKYNVLWRDNKNFFFVGKTLEDSPRIFQTHQQKEGTQYVGPFVDGKALKQALKILRKVLPYRSCKTLPKKPCLWYQLGRCPAPCLLKSKLAKEISPVSSRIKVESQRNVKNLLKILQGKKTQVLKDLTREMKKRAKLKEFERAAKIRDQITALEKVLSHAQILQIPPVSAEIDWSKVQKILQKILNLPAGRKKVISRIEAYDVSNIQGQKATGAMITFLKGRPNKDFYRKFKIKIGGKPNDIAMIEEILSRRFAHQEWPFPDLILIDGGKAQLRASVKVKNQKVKSKNIIIMSLAKKENKLFVESREKPISLKSLRREIFNLILQLRDEAHRFALKYHQKLREIDLRGTL